MDNHPDTVPSLSASDQDEVQGAITTDAQPSANRRNGRDPMTRITVKFTVKELSLLSSLASDQLFRREFIDPQLPGYTPNPAELNLGKQLVERLRLLSERGTGTRLIRRNGATR
jgi:hypothetical protein